MTDMKWGIICSVPDFSPVIEKELKEFSEWLIDELEDHSGRFYLFHSFAEAPSFCFHSKPANKEAIYTVYEKIHQQHPEVIYVIHILPQKNSLEYTLMKDLTLNYSLIGQGVLLETASNKFEGIELENVLANMNQYIMRRMSQLITFQRAENKFRFIIYANNAPPLAAIDHAHGRFHDVQVEKCVETVLHTVDNDDSASVAGDLFEGTDVAAAVRDSPETLVVEGFPTIFNKFQVASFFSHSIFRPLSAFVTASGRAYVEFANKFHVVQAALSYIRDTSTIAANAEVGIRLRMRCADGGAQACLERRLASSVSAKRSELDASILASSALSI